MVDRALFILDADARWRLAHDARQWVLQRRKTPPRPSEGGSIADSGWRGTDYIGSEKRILHRCIAERGVVLTPEAEARLDALPDKFMDFAAMPADYTAAPASLGVAA